MKKYYKFLLIIPAIILAVIGLRIINPGSVKGSNINIQDIETNSSADIVLSQDNTSSNISSVSIDENIVTISNGGEYLISGILEDGQIIIDTLDEDVNIILDGVAINNPDGPAIYIEQAQDVLITLAENSTNILSDGGEYDNSDYGEDDPNAVIFSMSDIDIIGSEGAILRIEANYKDGIVSKDDLDISSLSAEIIAEDDGLRGKDSIEIVDSSLTISAEGDALKSDNEDEEKGYITITNSNITIDAGDDGIHGVNLVEIFSGNIDITNSFEGIEGKIINVYDGDISIVASDDGINVSDSSSGLGGGSVIPDANVNIYGGSIFMNAGGDGFDSNGSATMTGGTLIVNGPTDNRNGSIDVNGSFDISGGTLMAIGSSGMAETPSETSSQYVIQVNFDEAQSAETEVEIVDSNGEQVFIYESIKQFQSIVFSSEELQAGNTYTVLLDGAEYTNLTLDGIITTYGEVSQMSGRGSK